MQHKLSWRRPLLEKDRKCLDSSIFEERKKKPELCLNPLDMRHDKKHQSNFVFCLLFLSSGLLPIPKESSFYIYNYTCMSLPHSQLALLMLCCSPMKMERKYIISFSEGSLSESPKHSVALLSIPCPLSSVALMSPITCDRAATSIHQYPVTCSSWSPS